MLLPQLWRKDRLTFRIYAVDATFSKSSPLVLPQNHPIHRYSGSLRSAIILVLGRPEDRPGPPIWRRSRGCRCSHGKDRVGAGRKTKEAFDLMFAISLGTIFPSIDLFNSITSGTFRVNSYRPNASRTLRTISMTSVTTLVRRSPRAGQGLICATGTGSDWERKGAVGVGANVPSP